MKLFYVILGCIGLGLGAVGAAVPLLPAFPFLMLAAFCFARSSRRLNDWFLTAASYPGKEFLPYHCRKPAHLNEFAVPPNQLLSAR